MQTVIPSAFSALDNPVYLLYHNSRYVERNEIVMKILRKPQVAFSVAIAADILMLVAAVVLDAVRDKFPIEYTFTVESIAVNASDPYSFFGIIAALVLVLVVVMSAFIMIGGYISEGKKKAPRIIGGIALLVMSVGLILFSFLVVRGRQPDSIEYIAYTDDTLRIVVAEEKYDEDFGAVKFFKVDENSGSAELLASTDISMFANGDTERYSFAWETNTTLKVVFYDVNSSRVLLMPIE